ncbi:MAG: hypothetical protein HY865_13080 [Chloroflexi bacterium]|nr:hypothetical protein [Chloroflexota bacterium]
MKRKILSVISILVIGALSACGPEATPTLSVVDVQGTAIADAWMAVTQTQAAIPTATATPIPPTPTETLTPASTIAPLIIPTLDLAPVATLPDTSTTNPCNEPPPTKPLGTTVKIKFLNKSDGDVALAFGMTQENDKKECGTYNFTLGRYQELEVQVLAGCYWGYGWVTGNKPSTSQTPDVLCVTDTSKTTAIWITAEVINFH